MSKDLSVYLIRTDQGYIAKGWVFMFTSDIDDAYVYDTFRQAYDEMMRCCEHRSNFCGQIMKLTVLQSIPGATVSMPVESKRLVMVDWTRGAMGNPVETPKSVPAQEVKETKRYVWFSNASLRRKDDATKGLQRRTN